MDPTMQNMGGMPQQQGQDPTVALLQQMTPEQLAAYLQGGTDPQAQLLEQQQTMAHQLRQRQAGSQPYGAGAGIASGISGILGGVLQGKLAGQQQENVNQRQAAMQAIIQQLLGKKIDAGAVNAGATAGGYDPSQIAGSGI